MLKYTRNKLKSETGASSTIEMLFIMLFLFWILLTIVDLGFYFNTRYTVSNAAQNGARTAAVFGGVNTSISNKYGVQDWNTNLCPHTEIPIDNVVECMVYKELSETVNTVNSKVISIDCGPEKTSGIGDRTYCEIEFKYNGIAGSAMSFQGMTGRVRLTAETEVIHK